MGRSGTLGDVRFFGSTFSQSVKPENHHARHGYEAGPVYDMGPYPINAVRNLFGDEPMEVGATGYKRPGTGLGDFDDMVFVTLKFPGQPQALEPYNRAKRIDVKPVVKLSTVSEPRLVHAEKPAA